MANDENESQELKKRYHEIGRRLREIRTIASNMGGNTYHTSDAGYANINAFILAHFDELAKQYASMFNWYVVNVKQYDAKKLYGLLNDRLLDMLAIIKKMNVE